MPARPAGDPYADYAEEDARRSGQRSGAQYRNGHSAGDKESEAPQAPQAILVRLSDVVPQPLHWLWTGRIAFGKVTLVAGDPGLGKSYVTLEVAARLSRGCALFGDEQYGGFEPVTTLLMALEDDIADTVRTRLDRLDADTSRIVALQGIKERDRQSQRDIERIPQLDRDLMLLEDTLRQTGARLLILDPINAYLGKTDAHVDVSLRAVLTPLAAIASRTGAAVVVVTHANKGGEGNPLHRVMGSLAYVAAARSVLGMGTDPADPNRRVLVQIKSNLAPLAPSIGFRVVNGVVVWDGSPVSVTAETVFTNGMNANERSEGGPVLRDACDFLMKVLAGGRVESRQVLEEARQVGISQATLRRAQADIGVQATRSGFGPGARWYWEMPSAPIEDPNDVGF